MKKLYFLYLILGAFLWSCSKNDSSPASGSGSDTGVSGSLARFAIAGDVLYTVTTTDVKIFDVSEASNPIFKADQPFGFGIETIFPLGNTLFIGSEQGMYIYDISTPLLPQLQSRYQHILSCDPVVANEDFAYVTLSNGESRCARGLSQLEIIDISDKSKPKLLTTYAMINPQGLALNGDDLFVCDDKVKWFDVSKSPSILPKGVINEKAHDAIAIGTTLMLIGQNGLTQYDYSGSEPQLLSRINIGLSK